MTDQAHNLRSKIERLKHNKEAKTIAIASGKGGVGKSNVTLNFALSLCKEQKKVLIFDLDIGMGNIDILLGTPAKRTIVEMFENNLSIADIIEKGPQGLSFIAGGSGLNSLFVLNETKASHFFDQLQLLVEDYDYILFDLGAGVSEESLHFILAANECIMVTTPEPTSITDTYAMVKHVILQQSDLPINMVVNKSFSSKAGQQTMDRLQQVVMRFLNKEILPLGILPDDSTVTRAVSRQTPFLAYNEHAAISKALHKMTKHYLSGKQEVHTKSKAPFISRLKRLMLER
ncbi:MinD/ParA family protein [Pontibacillus salicampi]|uniref:MinD/ParA family protein n=1 Tax=Pontibacillus salicampi TaxID=1449801 RepID=A0ABV6LP20_9BACI